MASLFVRAERAAERVCDSRRLLVFGTVALAVTLLLLQRLPEANASYLWLALVVCAGAPLVAWTEEGPARRISLNLFVWALLVRVVAVAACHLLALADGGLLLGPDSSENMIVSADLAARAFQLESVPPAYYGSYNVAHYYLFAAAMRYFGADLFGLQVMNGTLVALAVALTYGFSRVLMPTAAALIGLAVAFNPNLIVLSSIDLLKDPSIVFAIALLVWAVVRSAREERIRRLVAYALPAIVAALYIRTVRFYALGYIEAAIVVAAVVILLTKRELVRRPAAIPCVLGVFLVAEVLPMQAAWPASPMLIVQQTLGAAAPMVDYAPGLVDAVTQNEVAPPAAAASATSASNLFRRLYGPFVWILPTDWRFSALSAGDYLLYPGMLVWYALLPFVVLGILDTGRRMLGRSRPRFDVMFLWFFTVIYFAQYLTINLSYRQRDVMFPFLLVFACLGASSIADPARGRRLYVAYWLALVMLACAHLTARSLLGA